LSNIVEFYFSIHPIIYDVLQMGNVMKSRSLLSLIILVVIISACTTGSPQVSTSVNLSTPTTFTPVATTIETNTPVVAKTTPTTLEETSTPVASQTPTLTTTQETTGTPTSSPSPTIDQNSNKIIIIDHTSVELFEKIPDEYIHAASQVSLLFRHASVGNNIHQGLGCLMNNIQPRPQSCDRDLPSEQIVYDPKYNHENWTFEFHQPPPEQNPGWYNKVGLFITRIDSLTPEESYDYAGFKLGYVDAFPGSEIEDQFFNNSTSTFPTIKDLEDLAMRHPEITFVYWTLALGRAIGSAESDSFNQQLREYALDHNKILMDIADIESHSQDGAPCFDNAGRGHEAICDEYTDEKNAGHLNALGSLRAAKAMWVLMARLAGWDGIPR